MTEELNRVIKKDEISIPATLAFRPDEIRTYQAAEPDDAYNMYAVCLAPTPEYPPRAASTRCVPLAVLCLQFATWGHDMFPSWGWIHIDADSKRLIGQDLEDNEAEPGKWYYMTLSV